MLIERFLGALHSISASSKATFVYKSRESVQELSQIASVGLFFLSSIFLRSNFENTLERKSTEHNLRARKKRQTERGEGDGRGKHSERERQRVRAKERDGTREICPEGNKRQMLYAQRKRCQRMY